MQLDGFPGCLFYFYTQQHKPSSVGPWPSVPVPPHSLSLSLFLQPPFLCLISRGPYSPRSYMVIYTRTPRHGWFPLEADSLVPIPVRSHPSCWAKTAGLPLPRALNPRTLRRLARCRRELATNLRQDKLARQRNTFAIISMWSVQVTFLAGQKNHDDPPFPIYRKRGGIHAIPVASIDLVIVIVERDGVASEWRTTREFVSRSWTHLKFYGKRMKRELFHEFLGAFDMLVFHAENAQCPVDNG